MKPSFLCFLAFLSFVPLSNGQEKFEREERIEEVDVPEKARTFLSKVDDVKRLKWYSETSQDGKSIEAKFRAKGKSLSVEFTTDGKLIDIEIGVQLSNLSDAHQDMLRKSLQSKFKKFRIRKIQQQYKDLNPKQLNTLLHTSLAKDNLSYNFELIVKGKVGTSYELYEILISDSGILLKQLQFDPANSLNMQF